MKKLLLILMTTVLGACAQQQPTNQASLNGEVFYLQRVALPPAATMTVSLQDISRADAPVVILARQTAPVNGQVPLPFSLTYDPKHVIPGHRYSVSAHIDLDGKLLFISTGQHGVQLNGQDPQPLRIRLDSVQ
ncbi:MULTISPECIES: YbaY family lipoprotein [unclassified Pseudomonas]|uniref:YbaY family lipoprotein n=1 Tax=unclassified Pseudomonas TaxID=196821 RepID=UPI002AC9A126|nr:MULTISPECIES: YbaY family lipoprotein [unclassified Pseudomonas]MEB0039593.1 YbaY family lipoprotein [Pseudomonas sp. MH10]MEB0120188.1 YbaY family lipoprotein [Pseudomonas sp. CCI1.2]WPX65997.1 YbaY family lipoprotein [Pseudomonas sp. MH10]